MSIPFMPAMFESSLKKKAFSDQLAAVGNFLYSFSSIGGFIPRTLGLLPPSPGFHPSLTFSILVGLEFRPTGFFFISPFSTIPFPLCITNTGLPRHFFHQINV